MLKKIFYFPLTRIIIGFIIVSGFYMLSSFLLENILTSISLGLDYKNLIIGVISSIITVFLYIILYQHYEERNVQEFSTSKIGRNLVWGVFLGFILQSLTILVIYIFGGYTIESINSFVFLLPALTIGFISAVIEEILIRGIIFRITEESLGSYIALVISAIIFGALHLGNPNSSLIASLGIAIQAGLLLGVAYMYTRNLWFPIAIHFAWNFTQAGIYGASVSGHTIEKSLLVSKIEGAEWLTGGSFGPEGSIQATIFCVIATLILLQLCHKNDHIISPFWKRKKTE